MSNSHNLPPKTCPYCGDAVGHLPSHLPCDAVPKTEDVIQT